jgi:hypothetical protein
MNERPTKQKVKKELRALPKNLPKIPAKQKPKNGNNNINKYIIFYPLINILIKTRNAINIQTYWKD